MKLKVDQVRILDGILCILSRLRSDENHDIVSGIIVDYLNEVGFSAETEYNINYKMKIDNKVVNRKGRIDFYALRDEFYILGEIERSKVSTASIRKLRMRVNSVKLLILQKQACGYAYISPYIHHLEKFLIIPLKVGHLIQSDINGYHAKPLENFRADKQRDYLPRRLVDHFHRVLPKPK